MQLAYSCRLIGLCASGLLFSGLGSAAEPAVDPGFVQLMGGFGEPVGVTQRASGPEGESIFGFADGSRLVVKPMKEKPGRVVVRVLVGGGKFSLPPSLAASTWTVPFLAAGGTSAATLKEIEQWLGSSGHSAQFNIVALPSSFSMGGEVSSADLAYQLASVCGIARNAEVTTEMAAKLRQFGAELPTHIEANPGLVFARLVQRGSAGLGPRFSEFPLRAEISADPSGDLEQIAGRLRGPYDIAVVGDVDPVAAVAAVSETCAAGRPVEAQRTVLRANVRFKAGVQSARFTAGPSTVGSRLEGLFWPAEQVVQSAAESLALDVLGNVLQVRLSLRLSSPGRRVVPAVGIGARGDLPAGGYFGVGLDGVSLKGKLLTSVVDQELAAMVTDPALDGQVVLVRKAMSRDANAQLSSVDRLAEILALGLSDPSRAEQFRRRAADLASIDAGDVRRLAVRLRNLRSRAVFHVAGSTPK